MGRAKKIGEKDLASVGGQILLCLVDGPKPATEIYRYVKASQPTVSKRLSELLSKDVIRLSHTPDDRRINIYSINYAFFESVNAEYDISNLVRLADIFRQNIENKGTSGS